MPAESALRQLLAGSGLALQQTRSGVFIVLRAVASPSTPPPADVEVPAPPEIVVTARKREERAVDVPLALTAFPGSALRRRGARTLGDILQEAPGVGIYEQGQGGQKITIRGISTSLGANENGYYLDDLPFTGVTVPIAPDVRVWDLDRVEVLRGPQGTLFGEGSMGGTVRILTNRADLDNWEGEGLTFASTTADGGTNVGVKGVLNAPVLPGVLAVRVAGTSERLPGWIDAPASGRLDVNDQAITTVRAKMRFRPLDRLELNAGYWRYAGKFPGGGASATDRGEQSRALALDVTTGYRLLGASVHYDLDVADAFYGYSNANFDILQTGMLLGGDIYSRATVRVDAHEVRLASVGTGPVEWTVGGYLRDADRKDRFDFALLRLANVREDVSRARALFGEITYRLPSVPVDVTAGLRYYHERLRGSEVEADVRVMRPTTGFQSWNPRFSLAWHPRTEVTIYASAAKGFRAGQLQPAVSQVLAPSAGISLPDALAQDWIWTYEIGGKAQLLNRRLTIEAAIYHSRWRDVAIRVPIGATGFNGLINSSGTSTKGIEFSATFTPIAGLNVIGGGAYIDAVYMESVPNTGIVRGAPVDDVARFSANASMEYKRDLVEGVEGYGRIGLQHSGPRRFVSFAGYLPGDAINRVDARVGVNLGRTSIAIFVDNLTDERGATSYRTVQQIAPGTDDVVAYRLRPRTIGVELSAGFGPRM